jgi:hypothetical protein
MRGMTAASPPPGRHESPDPPVETKGFGAELKDAISIRTFALVLGVLGLQLGFILSYSGAFHSPRPHRIALAVVAPQQAAPQIVSRLNAIAGEPLKVTAAATEQAARSQIERGDVAGALVVDPQGSTDKLLIASAGGTSLSTALESVVTEADAAQQRKISLGDVVALQPGDGRGLTGFYLVIGWIVGGYLVAALLGVAKGSRPANIRRGTIRLAAMVPYAIVSGFGGALVVGPVLGALTGHFMELWWLGALLVYAAAAVTMAFQVLFGVIGIGITVLIFVILGNPSAGGAYQVQLLPGFWRAISYALPNGAGTDSVRRVVYFGANGIGVHLLVIAAYAVVGTAVALLSTKLRPPRPS